MDMSTRVFTNPFAGPTSDLHPDVKAKADRSIWKNDKLKAEVARLKNIFDTQEECLIGGNVSPTSTIMKNGTAHVRLQVLC